MSQKKLPARAEQFVPHKQAGVVLVVAMVLLIMITLFAITAIRSSTSELQIVGNAQVRKELAAAAQEGIENRINSVSDFNNVIAGVPLSAASYPLQGGRYGVEVSAPRCLKAVATLGNSLVNAGVSASDTTYWEVDATVTDNNTGATMQTTQGLKMRMPANSCPL